MNTVDVPTRRKAPLNTPHRLTAEATHDISAALTAVLADTFALYFKTKNFHWHVSGPRFRDLHLLPEEQACQILAATDAIAERVREIGGTTLRSLGHAALMSRVLDNDADYVTATDMLAELQGDNADLAARLTEVHGSATPMPTPQPRASSTPGSTRPTAARGSCSRRAAPNADLPN